MFIEPKGGDRLTNEDSQIKEKFLLQLEKDYKLQVVYENRDYKLVGMPLYNETGCISKCRLNKKICNLPKSLQRRDFYRAKSLQRRDFYISQVPPLEGFREVKVDKRQNEIHPITS
jgi:hypothetical protein